MNYLSPFTLIIFLYLLYKEGFISLSNFNQVERENIVEDFFNNKLLDILIFKTSKGILKQSELDYSKKNFDFDFSINSETSEIELDESNRNKLINFIETYITEFETDGLISEKNNFYSFAKNISEFSKLLEPLYKSYGKRFNIEILLKETFKNNLFEKEIRFFETLFYFIIKKYISINSCNIDKHLKPLGDLEVYEEEKFLTINLTFYSSLEEIIDIEKYWIIYGDIRANERDGIVFYKNNRWPYKSTKTKSFMLLCYLIKNHGEKININDVYSLIWSENQDNEKIEFSFKKTAIKDSIKEIKKNLKITQDKNPSIFLTVSEQKILLISNPSIK